MHRKHYTILTPVNGQSFVSEKLGLSSNMGHFWVVLALTKTSKKLKLEKFCFYIFCLTKLQIFIIYILKGFSSKFPYYLKNPIFCKNMTGLRMPKYSCSYGFWYPLFLTISLKMMFFREICQLNKLISFI